MTKEKKQFGDRIYQFKLTSGQPVIFYQKKYFKTVKASITVNFGGKHSSVNKIGIPAGTAHFLEHKLFEKSNGDLMQAFSKNGADVNAYTSHDVTKYYFQSIKDEYFFDNVKLLNQLVYESFFRQESIKKEQLIIGQEIDMNIDNPYSQLFDGLYETTYKNSDLSRTVLGNKQSIKTVSAKLLKELHKKIYQPKNTLLSITGDFKISELKKILEEASFDVKESNLNLSTEFRDIKSKITSKKSNVQEILSGMIIKVPKKFISAENKVSLDLILELLFGESSDWAQREYRNGKIDDFFEFGSEIADDYLNVFFLSRGLTAEKLSEMIKQRLGETKTLDKTSFNVLKKAEIGYLVSTLDNIGQLDDNDLQAINLNYTNYDLINLIENSNLNEAIGIFKKEINESEFFGYSLLPKK